MTTYAINSSGAPLAVSARGVSRSYGEDGLDSPARASLRAAVPYRLVQTWSESSQQDRRELILADLRDRTDALAEGLRLFDIPDRTALHSYRAAVSSAPDSFTAEAEDGAPTGLHHVQVSGLAQAQTNTSRRLASAEAAVLEAGDYVFELEVNGEIRSVAVGLAGTGRDAETNRDMLERIGRQIMAADDRLTASVETRQQAGTDGLDVETAALAVRSRTSGEDVRFSLSDTSGDLVERLKLDRASPTAAAGRLDFDHRLYESGDDRVAVDEAGVTVSLWQPTSGAETLEVQPGASALERQVFDLVDRYNDYMMFLKANRGELDGVILRDLQGEADANQSALTEIGLPPRGDGRLIYTARFGQLLTGEPERAADVLTGETGFFTGVQKVLERVQSRDLNEYGKRIEALPRVYRGTAKFADILRLGLNVSVSA